MWPYYPELLATPVPRYTSYPTAAEFHDGVGEKQQRAGLQEVAADDPLSLCFHSWTESEIEKFRKSHALGTKARLALETILWTGQRRGDAHRFGPPHVRDGQIKYEQEKGGKELWLPMAPQLRTAIDAMPSIGVHTFLVTEHGKPFSKAGFGNWFRDRCDEAGLKHCAAHGLRKAIARRLAENGATQKMIKSVGGWSNDREVAIYTAGADQAELARTALTSLAEWELRTREGQN